MQIQMIDTRRGSDDGHNVRCFDKGLIYVIGQDIGHTLACRFVSNGWAHVLEEINQSAA